MFKQNIRTDLSLPLQVYSTGIGLPKSRVVRKQSLNGEIHLILPESMFDETKETAKDLDEAEIRKIMKKEVSKPLLLLRAE
jgi:hypothetical protein